MATRFQPHSSTYKGVDLALIGDAALHVAEAVIYADAAVAARNPPGLKSGQLMPRTIEDRTTGTRRTEFFGSESFIAGMGPPPRVVAGLPGLNLRRN